ncbi:hypothetical protein L6R50_19960 [Myxococcota bacterium]|nr:hypothetical protein [Myxococcota bacterium]
MNLNFTAWMAQNWGWLTGAAGMAVGAIVWATALYLRVRDTHQLVVQLHQVVYQHRHDDEDGRVIVDRPPPLATANGSWPL